MSQSLVKNMIHLVYGKKQRQPWIAKVHRDGLFAYQAGIYKEWDSPALAIGGVNDHVHSLFSLSKNHPAEEDRGGSEKGEVRSG
jgi:putative transposase